MGTHWTYCEESDCTSDLKQGDILKPTKDIKSILEDVHPHFLDPKYSAFLVLTQSCDLMRREGKGASSRYINLAVVRPLIQVLPSLLDRACSRRADGIYTIESKRNAFDLLSRIINQNEQKLGLFYLHPEVGAGIAEGSVALLQVNVTLKTDHYEDLLSARTGRLLPVFRDKLGWLIGNLFSRVATQDWPERDISKICKTFLDVQESGIDIQWIEKATLDAASHAGVFDSDNSTRDELVTRIHEHRPPTKLDQALQKIERETEKLLKDEIHKGNSTLTEDSVDQIIEKLIYRLKNNPQFEKAIDEA